MNGNFINNLPPQFASHNGQILPQGNDSSRIPSSLQYPGDNLGYMEADFTSSERWQSHGVNPKDIFGSLPMATSHSSMSMGRGMPPSLGVNTGIDRMDHKGNPYVVGFDLTGSRGHLVHVPPPMMQPQEHFYPPVQGGRADAIPTGTGYPGFPLGTSGSSRSTNVPDESGRYSSTRKCVRTSAKKSSSTSSPSPPLNAIYQSEHGHFFCPKCPFSHHDLYTTTKHAKENHKGIKTVICGDCRTWFADEYTLKTHFERKKRPCNIIVHNAYCIANGLRTM